jgi:hypothetical protein
MPQPPVVPRPRTAGGLDRADPDPPAARMGWPAHRRPPRAVHYASIPCKKGRTTARGWFCAWHEATRPGWRNGRVGVTDGIGDTGETVDALRQELARRTADVDTLRAEVSALTAKLGSYDEQVVVWRAKAAEYDALMQTKTMHAVRIPRAIYGRILAHRAR